MSEHGRRQRIADGQGYDHPEDVDDRKRCTCIANHRLQRPWATDQCLNFTRHPSGVCGDCRPFPVQK